MEGRSMPPSDPIISNIIWQLRAANDIPSPYLGSANFWQLFLARGFPSPPPVYAHYHHPFFAFLKGNLDTHFINRSTALDTKLTNGRLCLSMVR